MKRSVLWSLVACVVACSQCLAFEVNVSRIAGYWEGDGGEFTVTALVPTDPTFQAILQQYDSSTTLSGGFQTFCLNKGVNFLSNPLGATLNPNGVTVGTAFLYSLFVKQQLVGYDYTPDTTVLQSPRALSAWALQNAIWALQGSAGYDPTAAAVVLSSPQFTTAFPTLAAAMQPNNGTYPVDALLMVDRSGKTSQPLLAMVNTPNTVCTGSICGKVVKDSNCDGNLAGDTGIAGVTVTLKNASGMIVATTTTDTGGNYCFPGLAKGTYTVVITPPANCQQTKGCTTFSWADIFGRACWVDWDKLVHWRERDGTHCWLDNNGQAHWKDLNGNCHRLGGDGKVYDDTATGETCRDSDGQNNERQVCLQACENKILDSFGYCNNRNGFNWNANNWNANNWNANNWNANNWNGNNWNGCNQNGNGGGHH